MTVAPSVNKVALGQMATTLAKLVTATVLKSVHTEPTALMQTPELPAAWFVPGIDDQKYVGIPGNDEEIYGSIEIYLYANLVGANQTVPQDMMDIVDAVRAQITTDIADFRALTPRVYITAVPMLEKPDVDMFGNRAIAKLAVKYHN